MSTIRRWSKMRAGSFLTWDHSGGGSLVWWFSCWGVWRGGGVFVAQLFFVLVDVDEGEVGDADCSFYGVAFGFAKCAHLFHVDPFEAGQLFEDAVSGLFEAFAGLEEASHEA